MGTLSDVSIELVENFAVAIAIIALAIVAAIVTKSQDDKRTAHEEHDRKPKTPSA